MSAPSPDGAGSKQGKSAAVYDDWVAAAFGTHPASVKGGGSEPEHPDHSPDPEPTPPAGGRPKLRNGDKGAAVEDCQTMLNGHGASLAVDGHFGDLTTAAVKGFQTSNPPLKSDGVVGDLTWAALSAGKPAPGPAPDPSPAPAQDPFLLITVKDEAGNSVMNATVVIDNEAPATTGQGSNRLFIRVKPGEHICRVMQPGYKEFKESVTVGSEPTTALDVSLAADGPAPGSEISFGVQVLSAGRSGQPAPLPGASFSIGGKSQLTDRSGFARIDLPAGSYVYQVAAKGCQSHDGLMKSDNQTHVMHTVLLERGATLLINTKSSDGQAAMDVTIQIDDEEPNSTGRGSSKLFIHDVAPGQHTFTATADGFRDENGDFRMDVTDTPLEIVLTPSGAPDPAVPTGSLSLKVVWAGTKEPVRNAMATVDPPPLPPSATMELAGDDGLLSFEKLAVGPCTITAEMHGSKATQAVTISADTTELAEIELPRPVGGRLTVKVVWAGGNRPAGNAMVSVDPAPLPPAALFEVADDKGIANFDDVVAGPCTVTAKSQGSVGKAKVTISEDSIELATIVLPVHAPAGGKLHVKVLNKGQPVAGQKVTVTSDDRRPQQLRQEAETKDDGVAAFSLPVGTYVVTSRIAPFAISVGIEAGKTKEVAFDGKASPEVVVDVVPWNTYFNEQFPLCEKEWFILNIGKTIPIFPGPGGTGTNYVLECMSRNVTARVAAEDKLAGRSAQAGRTRGELRGWYQKNKGKFDGLDTVL